VTGIFGNVVLVYSGLHMPKNFSEHNMKFELGLKKFYQPFPRPKIYKTSVLRAPIYKLVRGEKLLTCPACSHVSGWHQWSGCKIYTQCSMDVSPKRNATYVVTVLAQCSIQNTTCKQIFGTNSPWRLNFVRWSLLFEFLGTKLLCHPPFEVAHKSLRNLCTPTIDNYFMCDVIINFSIMRTFMLLQKLRLDRQFFSKNQEEQQKSILHFYSSS
jgi:hypothetical protein